MSAVTDALLYRAQRIAELEQQLAAKDEKIMMLRKALRDASGTMSNERWSSDFRARVRGLLK